MAEDDSEHGRDLDAAGLIICDAIADALERLKEEMPSLTAQEIAAAFERAVEITRHAEDWPEPPQKVGH
jgi:hypothetical protein